MDPGLEKYLIYLACLTISVSIYKSKGKLFVQYWKRHFVLFIVMTQVNVKVGKNKCKKKKYYAQLNSVQVNLYLYIRIHLDGISIARRSNYQTSTPIHNNNFKKTLKRNTKDKRIFIQLYICLF